MKSIFRESLIWLLAVAVALPLRVGAQDASQPAPFKAEEIEQLVAPIALYPDSLIAQILMASTYPLEVVQAARWVKQNPKVTGKALEDAMQKQPWDPSVKSLTAFPQALDMMNAKLDMTQKLGDAFLGQQKEVMAAIQKLRGKAQAAGNLKSGKEQTVSTAQEGGTTVIKIEPANPEVVYVPTYNPTTVYGSWPYPAYPPYYYYPPGYVPGAALFSFGVGLAVGSALWGGANWGGSNVYINHNNYNNFNRTNVQQNQNWQHNSEHRQGVQYRDSGSQQKFGGGQRQGADSREAFRGRAEQGRQDIGRGGADQFKGGDRGGGVGDRGGAGDRGGGPGDRGGVSDRGGGPGDRGGAGDRGGGGPGDRGGATQRTGGASAFDGAGRSSGAQARDASSRGASSRQSATSSGARAGGGGGARAGGGGGGARGGGGGGRR